MAHQSRFLSVNLNKSYGKSSSSSSPSSSSTYGNGRPRSAGGGGGMVVLSRPRSSSGASAHKPASRLSVPPPVNLPSLRKEHERLDPTSSKPSAGHSGSGLHGHNSSMSWTKPTPPVPEFRDKEDVGRSLSQGEQQRFGGTSRPQGFGGRTVILKGEDFPSLLATSNLSSKHKQSPVIENSEVWAEKGELSLALDMRPQLRTAPLTKSDGHGNERGISRIQSSSGQENGKFPAPLPLVKLRHTSDWDDDERDRNRSSSGNDHYDGRALIDGEARNSLSRDSGRGDPYVKDFMASKKEDPNASSWRVAVQPNRELSTSRHVDRDHAGLKNSFLHRGTGKESSHDRFHYGDRREVGFGMGTRNAGAEPPNDRVEVSSNWQRGKPFGTGLISKGPVSPRIKGFPKNDHVQRFANEKLISNVGKSYAENTSWGGKDSFSSDAILDLNAKVFRKKKEAIKHTDLIDPVRESFEAELERVQRLQEQERQRVMEEQARILEFARRESEERERIAREEEERRRLLEEEAREAVWRAEQEKMEAVRRSEEQRIAREEERRKILMEEERRKEAARQMLLELEARIARRQTEAATNDRMKETDSSRDSDLAEWEKNERMVEHITGSTSFNSSGMSGLSEAGFKPHFSKFENYSSIHRGKPENWNNNYNPVIKFQDQDSGYPSARQDTISTRSFHRKQFHGIHGAKPVTSSFKKVTSDDQAHTEQSWDRNRDSDHVNMRSSVDTMFGGWDHGHFDGNQLVSFSERSFQNIEGDDVSSFSRVRHTMRQPRVPPPPSLSSSMCKSPFRAASTGLNSSFSGNTDARSDQTVLNGESDIQILYGCSYNQRILETGTPQVLEESASSLLQTEEKSSPRYDSQSSLSVSNPPSSPTQLSHDEFDDCEGSPALTTSVEEENMTSEIKSMIPELGAGKFDTEMLPFSPGEDDEWAVEDHEEMLEEEEDHNEIFDSNQEDGNEPGNISGMLEKTNKLEDFDGVVEKPKEMCDTSYGIDSCLQLGASDGKMSTNPGLATDSISELVLSNSSAAFLQLEDTMHDKIMKACPEIAEITVEAQEDHFLGPIASSDHPTDTIRASKSSVQNPIAAVARLPFLSTSSSCSISTTAPTSSGEDDIPAKLQFGLFSSPPLIPSPVPTIQIGSIQMPLPLKAQMDTYTQVHHSHSPLFQFGQLRHISPISQSVLPMGSQTVSFVHPPIARHSLDRKHGSSSNNQVNQDSMTVKGLNKGHPSVSADKQPVCVPDIIIPNQSILESDQPTELFNSQRDEVLLSHRPISAVTSDEKKASRKLISGSDNHDCSSNKNFRSMVHSRRARGRPHNVDSYSSARRYFTGQRAPGTMSEMKGNNLMYTVRNAGPLPSFLPTETLFVKSNQPQRRVRRHVQGTEYRVKASDGARNMQSTESFYYDSHRLKPSLVGPSSRNVTRKHLITNKSNLENEETAPSSLHVVDADNSNSRDNKKETMRFTRDTSSSFHGSIGNLSKAVLLDDDIDAPLRSGIVRVFNQPGIEASSDGDGFVEVRSKRKISNERRGQRERESISKHQVPRRHHTNVSGNGTTYKTEMVATLAGRSTAKNIHHKRPYDLEESKLPITGLACQTIPPSGPAVNCTDYDIKSNSLKSSQTGNGLAIANGGMKIVPSLSFGNDIVALDKVSVPLGNWSTVHLNQTAITSSQSEVDEPSNCEKLSQVSAAKDDNSNIAMSSVIKEKPSFSSENLLNLSFDGGRIQFGAVAPPSSLPPAIQSASSGVWPPGSVMLNASIIHSLPMNDQSNFFDKDKFPSESCGHLDDTEAEAEAAASAVAVAAITNDEISVSRSGTISISGIGIKALSGPGLTSCTDATRQSSSEESLVVTLPADLSVDTPLSLWPPIPNLQSSRPMLSHIAGTQPSSFPFFDPSPMLGGPIFAFRPQDEPTGAQAQQQQSAAFVSGPTGTWPQCHSGVDSFYGSPTGFPAPFISPPAGLPGIHAHPPMVFYNHFAPVGQFGQVGLSYMGNNYLSTGKKPDWKHGSEGITTVNMNKTDSNNLNIVYGQQSATHIPTPIQHLSTGSAVMQVTSPFTMFNLRPFQSSTEIPVPAQWQTPPIPRPSSHAVRLSTPPEQLQSMPSDSSNTKLTSPVPHSVAADLPDELGLVESTVSNSSNTIHPSRNHETTNINKDSNGIHSSAARLSDDIRQNTSSSPQDFEATSSPIRQHLGPIGKMSGSSMNSSSGSEWGRRNSFQGRHHRNGNNKNVGVVKTKQIYVAKSLLTSPATSS